jgi:2-hydroxychromene-2-carboxylate isomerase
MTVEPVFYYDFNSPYSYMAANRIDEVLPVRPRWQPIAFGPLTMQIEKLPWSRQPGPERDRRQRECKERLAAMGLPLNWPEGWPVENYSILALRAALVADEHDRLREFSLAAYRAGLGEGRSLREPDVVADVAREAGLDPEEVGRRVADDEIKERLTAATAAAREAGVTGIPTVRVGDELFWGDDRLEEAARALAAG